MSITPLGGRGMIGGALGRGYRRAAAAEPWWLAGGVAAANCIAAYQPKGAASLEASYINLANPGVHTAAPRTAAPAWNTNVGWSAPGNLISETIISTSNMTVVYRMSNAKQAPYNNGTIAYAKNLHGLMMHSTEISGRLQAEQRKFTVSQPYAGVVAYNKNGVYENGILVTTSFGNLLNTPETGTGIFNTALTWGGMYVSLTCEACAWYDIPLTPEQIAAVSAAVAAL